MVGPCFWLAARKPKCLLPAAAAVDPWKRQWRSVAILVVLIITGYGLGFSVVDFLPHLYNLRRRKKSEMLITKDQKSLVSVLDTSRPQHRSASLMLL